MAPCLIATWERKCHKPTNRPGDPQDLICMTPPTTMQSSRNASDVIISLSNLIAKETLHPNLGIL